jgi:hypothetical protein
VKNTDLDILSSRSEHVFKYLLKKRGKQQILTWSLPFSKLDRKINPSNRKNLESCQKYEPYSTKQVIITLLSIRENEREAKYFARPKFKVASGTYFSFWLDN